MKWNTLELNETMEEPDIEIRLYFKNEYPEEIDGRNPVEYFESPEENEKPAEQDKLDQIWKQTNTRIP
jgi:hypothetical protein